MFQAIETEYRGPTNHSGSRIIVRAQAGRMIVPWDYALNVEQNHIAAAQAFAKRWDWEGIYVGGARPNDKGYVFTRMSGTYDRYSFRV